MNKGLKDKEWNDFHGAIELTQGMIAKCFLQLEDAATDYETPIESVREFHEKDGMFVWERVDDRKSYVMFLHTHDYQSMLYVYSVTSWGDGDVIYHVHPYMYACIRRNNGTRWFNFLDTDSPNWSSVRYLTRIIEGIEDEICAPEDERW